MVAETLVAATPPETARASSVPALVTLVALIVTVASPSPRNNKERALGTVASAMMVLVLLTVPPLIVKVALPEAAPADAIMEPELPIKLPLSVTAAVASGEPANASTAPALAMVPSMSSVPPLTASASVPAPNTAPPLTTSVPPAEASSLSSAPNVTALSVKAPPRAATREFDTMAALTIVAEPPG